MLLSLIVPCYNEQEALPLFYREVTNVLAQMNCDHELILINDGSSDNTLSIMKELAASDPHVFYYSFSRNFGKESAMYAGFCNARGDYVAVMDASGSSRAGNTTVSRPGARTGQASRRYAAGSPAGFTN